MEHVTVAKATINKMHNEQIRANTSVGLKLQQKPFVLISRILKIYSKSRDVIESNIKIYSTLQTSS